MRRSDVECPSCDAVLTADRRNKPRERPRPATTQDRKKPRRASPSVSTTGPQPELVPLNRLLHVAEDVDLRALKLHPYDAWVVSLIDGNSTGEMLNTKLALEARELQALLQGLLDREVIFLGDVATRGKKPQRASMDAPTRHIPAQSAPEEEGDVEADEGGPEPTQILSRAQFNKPGMPRGRDLNASIIGMPEDDDEESTVSQAKRVTERGVDRSELQRAAWGESGQKLSLPRPSAIAEPEPETQLHDGDADRDAAEDDDVHGSLPQETVLLGRKPEPQGVAQETILVGKKPQPKPPRAPPRPVEPEPAPRKPTKAREPEPQRPMSAPGYRPPQPAPANRGVPKPTLGIEDVDAQGALQVAQQMEQAGRLEEAVAYLERALDRHPEAAPLHNRLAMILMRDFEDFARAEELILQALRLAPGHPMFTRNLNQVRQQVRDAKRKRR
ncbi:MAG: tetratricopeptide repeat protein [Deltaproteobacteria bacterium]|nr:tetratricopeptide repeat protein [Deltaproteobacteria bacterium]